MNYNRILFLILIAWLTIITLATSTRQVREGQRENKLQLEISSVEQSYMLGEKVVLKLTLTNRGDRAVSLFDDLDPVYGYTQLFISSDNGADFKKYEHSRWGLRDSKPKVLTLEPGESIDRAVGIVWNSKRTFHPSVSAEIIEKETANRILSDYAFQDAGLHYIKAVYSVQVIDDNRQERVDVASDSVKIVINEPEGEDLQVWNSIKGDGGIAYFVQEGNFFVPGFNEEKREQLERKVEKLLMLHPSSSYSQPLRSQLSLLREKQRKTKTQGQQ